MTFQQDCAPRVFISQSVEIDSVRAVMGSALVRAIPNFFWVFRVEYLLAPSVVNGYFITFKSFSAYEEYVVLAIIIGGKCIWNVNWEEDV